MKKIKNLKSVLYEGHLRKLKQGLLFDSLYDVEGNCVECFPNPIPMIIAKSVMLILLLATVYCLK